MGTGGPSCQLQAGSTLLLSSYGQVPAGQRASYITAGRFIHLGPKPELLANYLDTLIACLISPRRPPEPSLLPPETLPMTAFVYQDRWCGVPAPLPTTSGVYVMDLSSCYRILLSLAPAYLCLCSSRMGLIATQTWLVASVASPALTGIGVTLGHP